MFLLSTTTSTSTSTSTLTSLWLWCLFFGLNNSKLAIFVSLTESHRLWKSNCVNQILVVCLVLTLLCKNRIHSYPFRLKLPFLLRTSISCFITEIISLNFLYSVLCSRLVINPSIIPKVGQYSIWFLPLWTYTQEEIPNIHLLVALVD